MKTNSKKLLKNLDKLRIGKALEIMTQYFLGKHFRTETPPLHLKWFGLLNKLRLIIVAPRGFAKSTVFALGYVMFCVLFKRKKFIVIISDSQTQAEELLGTIIEELETNKFIIAIFGKIAGYIPPRAEDKKKWTTKEIVTTTQIKIVAKGITSKLRGLKFDGQRPDLILLDDIENDINVENVEYRNKVEKIFKKSISNLGDATTQIVWVGTILHFDSVLQRYVDDPPKGYHVEFDVASPDLWPTYWTEERLELKKEEIGTLAYEQEYMNNPIDPSTQILKFTSFYDSIDLNQCDKFVYIDLSNREKEINDFTAMVTIAKHRDTGKLYIIDPQKLKGKVEDQVNFVIDYYLRYKHNILAIEDNSFQIWFVQLLQKEALANGIYIPIKQITQIRDKVSRAKSVSVYLENGTVSSNTNYQDFNSEVEHFPKAKHDDQTDSMVEGIKLAIGIGLDDQIKSGSNSTNSKPPSKYRQKPNKNYI